MSYSLNNIPPPFGDPSVPSWTGSNFVPNGGGDCEYLLGANGTPQRDANGGPSTTGGSWGLAPAEELSLARGQGPR